MRRRTAEDDVTTAQDAAVLYFALHGTDAPLTCMHYEPGVPATKCGKTLAGLAHGDGAALCEEHLQTEEGHLLDLDTIAELWLVKRTLRAVKAGYKPSALERFALKVAGIDPTSDTIPAPPSKHDDEAKIRGHLR
jgi:hypothetical protein